MCYPRASVDIQIGRHSGDSASWHTSCPPSKTWPPFLFFFFGFQARWIEPVITVFITLTQSRCCSHPLLSPRVVKLSELKGKLPYKSAVQKAMSREHFSRLSTLETIYLPLNYVFLLTMICGCWKTSLLKKKNQRRQRKWIKPLLRWGKPKNLRGESCQ